MKGKFDADMAGFNVLYHESSNNSIKIMPDSFTVFLYGSLGHVVFAIRAKVKQNWYKFYIVVVETYICIRLICFSSSGKHTKDSFCMDFVRLQVH